MRLLPHQVFLLALRGREALLGRRLPSREDARDGLRRLTGQDFGYDAEQWSEWLKRNRKGLYRRHGMSESGWLNAKEPRAMLAFLRDTGRATPRKRRLFACAYCRRTLWHLLGDERSRRAVEVAEQFADGLASGEERDAARRAASNAIRKLRRGCTRETTLEAASPCVPDQRKAAAA